MPPLSRGWHGQSALRGFLWPARERLLAKSFLSCLADVTQLEHYPMHLEFTSLILVRACA